MTLRNVPNSFTLEQQRQEVNEIAVDLDTAVDGVQTFGGSKTFSNDVTFSSDVTFQAQAFWGDGDQAVFGADSDMLLYHTGLVGLLENTTGDFYLRSGAGTAIHIEPAAGADSIIANAGGNVELYYDDVKKLETNLTGATVLGDLEVNDELHSASGSFIIKTADQITPGQMVTEAVFGGSMYVPYGFSTYPIAEFPGGNITETSTNAGFSVSNGGQIYIANISEQALWKGRQVGTAGLTSEIDAAGNAEFAGTLDVSNTVTFNGDVTFTGVASDLIINPSTTFNNNAAFANDKVLNFGGASNGRILYVSATNSFDVRVPGGSEDLKLGAGTNVRITNENGLTDRAVFSASGLDVTGAVTSDSATFDGETIVKGDLLKRTAAGSTVVALRDDYLRVYDSPVSYDDYKISLEKTGAGLFGAASNSTGNNGVLVGGNNGSLNIYTDRYTTDCFQILNTTGSGTNVALKAYGNGDVEIAGIIQSNTKSAGNIELDSTGAFTSPPLKLFANTGDIATAGTLTFTGQTNSATGTASSDALDHYEEGTWTGTVSTNANLSAATFVEGYYTRIGQLVYIEGEVSYTNTGNNSELGFTITPPFDMATADDKGSVFCGSSYWSASRGFGGVVDNTSSNDNEIFVMLHQSQNDTGSTGICRFSLSYHAA